MTLAPRRALWLAPLLAALAPSLARAEPAPLPRLVVHAEPSVATECPDAGAIAATVEQLLGHPAFATAPDSVDAPSSREAYDVRIAHGGFYTASITTPGGGERELSDPGPGCSGLADAVALTLAILLDPEGHPPAARHAHSHTSPKSPAKPHPPPAPPAEDHGPWLAARAAGGAALGVLSSTAPVAFGGIEVRPSHLLSIGAGVVVPASTTTEYAAGQVDLSLVAGYLRVCGPEIGRPETLRLLVCLEPMLGSLRLAGQGYDVNNATTHALWGALGLGATLDATLVGPLGAFVDATGLVAGETQYTVKSASPPAPGTLPRVGAILGAGIRVTIF